MYRHGNNFPLEHDTLHIPLHTPRLLMVSLSSCSEHIQIHSHQRDAHTTIKKNCMRAVKVKLAFSNNIGCLYRESLSR